MHWLPSLDSVSCCTSSPTLKRGLLLWPEVRIDSSLTIVERRGRCVDIEASESHQQLSQTLSFGKDVSCIHEITASHHPTSPEMSDCLYKVGCLVTAISVVCPLSLRISSIQCAWTSRPGWISFDLIGTHVKNRTGDERQVCIDRVMAIPHSSAKCVYG